MTEQTARILFVDDEPTILNILEKLFSSEKWDCHYVSSANEALDFMQQNRVDLLVSDFMMPEKDGIELLVDVKQHYPQIIRLLLTAYAKDEKTTRALSEGYAQQIIPKPWIDQELKEIVRSALRQSAQQKKYSPEFQALLNTIPLLPALPKSYAQVQNCIHEDDVDIEKMATIIGLDVSLTSALLHWANSALFGQRYHVDTIKKAIIVLGTEIVISLILSEAVTRSLASTAPKTDSFDMDKFRRHSMATATLARMLIKSLYSSNGDLQDRAFIAALLHDLGKLIAASHFSEPFGAAVKKAHAEGIPLQEAEKELMGTDHTELGSFLAEWWALPHFITTAIEQHHKLQANLIEPDIVPAVYLANELSYQFGFGCNGEQQERTIDQAVLDKFIITDEGLEILQVETERLVNSLCS